MSKSVSIIEFPGTHGISRAKDIFSKLNYNIQVIWHGEEDLKNPDLVFLPGGASFADYLRPGALAIASPICGSLRRFAKDGGRIIGIANGFQILCELKILSGVLLENKSCKFIKHDVHLAVEETECVFLKNIETEKLIKTELVGRNCRFFLGSRALKDVEENNRVVFRYVDEYGDEDEKSKLHSSVNSIAGICNKEGNVLGVMPYIDRVEQITQVLNILS